MQWHFGPFRLDLANACLWRADQPVPLRPKTFDLLAYLVQHAGQLVPKEVLLAVVWPETAVSAGVLKTSMGELRHALGEIAKAPQWIATVRGRGYRFMAPVTTVPVAADRFPTAVLPPAVPLQHLPRTPLAVPASAPPADAVPCPPGLPSALRWLQAPSDPALPLLERDPVLHRLHAMLAQAAQGTRHVALLSGEAGIGKTALVEAFLAQATTNAALWIAGGQCVEQYGSGEAYLPVLEALGQLCRQPGGERLVSLLRQQAPTWLAQMPWLLTAADRVQLHQELYGTTRERMLREFAAVVETLTTQTPLLLVLEDLHWSDYATLDLLVFLARRRTPARLLLLGTYRPLEAVVQEHPLRTVVQGLRQHGYGTELSLSLLSESGVAQYLATRFPGHALPDTVAAWLSQHTEGNPLFLKLMVDALVAQGGVAEQAGQWRLLAPLEMAALALPAGLQALLEQRLERLPAAAQRVLRVASVVGVTFAAAAVAAGLEAELTEVETSCEQLVRQGLLRAVDQAVWPDGTLSMGYAFMHTLYQQVAYAQVGAGQRIQWHHRLARRLEAAYTARAGEIAAELAVHFEHGRDVPRAVQYWHQAGMNALQRHAPQEAQRALRRALGLLATLPETPVRAQQELEVQIALGPALIATKGYAAPEVEQTYARARALCTQIGDTPQLFPALQGLCGFYEGRGALLTARELGEQLYRLAQRETVPTHLLEASEVLGNTLFYLGDYAAARMHLEQGIAVTDPAAQRAQVLRSGYTPALWCLALSALTLWCLGYPAQAMQRGQEALTLAQALAHPQSLAVAQHFAASLHYRRREAPAVQAQAEALLTLATAQGFPLWVGYGTFWRGWAMAMQGQGAAARAQMHQGMTAVLATGQTLSRSLCLVLLAEAAGHAGQAEEGLHLLAEALEAIEASERGDLRAEAYRLQGECLLRQTVPDAVQAEACFQQALAIARRQQARAWELRAALSLARLWQRQGKRAEARQGLAEVYGWFTEGFDTADLREARALLEDLGT